MVPLSATGQGLPDRKVLYGQALRSAEAGQAEGAGVLSCVCGGIFGMDAVGGDQV